MTISYINKAIGIVLIITSYTHFKGYFKVVFSDEFISLLDRTKQFYQVPKCLLNSDVRYYRHSIFLGNYILLHQRRNKGKHNEFVISVKELVKNCPLLPMYEELANKQVYRAIISLFETNLSFASMLLGMSWDYVDEKPTSYIDFIRVKICLSGRNWSIRNLVCAIYNVGSIFTNPLFIRGC